MSARTEMLRTYAEAGLTLEEAAANLGVSYQSARRAAARDGIVFRHGNRKVNPDDRAVGMRDAYLSGRTLAEIGAEHGVTRERVRQIITKHFGCLARDGGKSFQARINRDKRLARLDAEAMQRWGCTRQQYAVLRRLTARLQSQGISREKTPIGAFAAQRSNAARRFISWELTLWEWWTIWQKSGKWSRRGRGRGRFVMCRKGDIGPYSADNVFIALNCENISSAVRMNDLPVGVTRLSSGFSARTVVNGKMVRLGVFDTAEQAHIAYLRSLSLEAA
jgi:hypothetical protein